MPNNLFTNPVVITTVMGSSFKTNLPSVYIRVGKIIWESPANVGDQVLITDPISNTTLLQATCETMSQSQVFDYTAQPFVYRDFIISRIDSGTLYLYLR